jgi:hypothetical protein
LALGIEPRRTFGERRHRTVIERRARGYHRLC